MGQALAGMAAAPLAGIAATAAANPAAPIGVHIPAGPSLNALAQQKGRRFGSCVGSHRRGALRGVVQNPYYTGILEAECGVVVPENEMKWQFTRRGPAEYDFAGMDAIVEWAQAAGIAVRGHTLLWHRTKWFPEWLNTYDYGANPAREAERLLVEHIRTVTDRYRGAITSYDVVNETVLRDGSGLEETSMSRALGSVEAVCDLAFHTARDQLPGAELVYNDYMSWEPADRTAHCRQVLKLLEGFRKRNVPVDTLGIQSHIEMLSLDPASGLGPYLERDWRQFLDEVVAMGYRLIVTEFDVKDTALPADIVLRDAKVAEFARRYFDIMLSYEQLGDVLAWGMVDDYCWLQGYAPRGDGLEVRCSPYSSDFRAKPLRDTLAAALAAGAQHNS
jgi:endo-1,4-beta-xylanase